MPYATEVSAGFAKEKSCSCWVKMFCAVTIGSSGAITSQTPDCKGLVVTYSTTGTYTLTFGTGSDAVIDAQVVSPAGTVVQAWVTAQDSAAGTATIKTINGGGSVVDPASGDKLKIRIEVKV